MKDGKVVTKVGYKNPLSQAFGIVLRRHRDRAGKTSKEISDFIGIGASYYRLIESGTNNLHVSKALALVEAFEAKFSFDSVSKILMAISIMEAMGNSAHHYAEGLKQAVEKMSEYDSEKLRPLFTPFQTHKLFDALKTKTSEDIAEYIERLKVDEVVDQFLVDYTNFGKSPAEIQNDYTTQFLRDIPTFYLQILSEIKDTLLRMPVKMGFESLWQWEELNKTNFSSIIGVVKEHKYITSLENLDRYKYRYLWESSFRSIKIIYLDDKEPDEVTALFRQNLKHSLIKAGEKEMLSTFEEKVTKIKFKQSKTFQFEELIKLDFDNEPASDNQSDLKVSLPNACWVYSLRNKSSIGILSYISPDNVMLASGRSLKIDSTAYLISYFNDTWNSI